MDDEEGVDLPEEDVVALDEVASPGVFGVVLEEGRPCLSTSPGADPSHVLLDGALADLDAELEQFPANALSAPEPTAAGHVANQHNVYPPTPAGGFVTGDWFGNAASPVLCKVE